MSNFLDENSLEDLIDEMKMVYLNDSRPWILGYSGGKDSSATLQLVFKMLESLTEQQRNKKVYVVSSDTMIENPVIQLYLKKNINKINETARNKNLPIEAKIIYPEVNDTYWVSLCGKGYPTPKSLQFRWCTDRLKIRPSNKFIKEQLELQEVVVLLGVRKDESVARRKRIEKREIEGYLLTPHATLRGKNNLAYVYTPIVEFTTADVWDVLYHNNTDYMDFGGYLGEEPATAWGTSAMELFDLYLKGTGDSGECPFIADETSSKSSCGNSRFGCWMCTVVKEDKSLNGFIDSGHEELRVLAECRKWIMEERDKPENRKTHKRNGKVNIKNGKVMPGSFTLEARGKILKKVLETQLIIQNYYPELELITEDELKAIEQLWKSETLERDLVQNIYEEVMGKSLPWKEHVEKLFQKDVIDIVNKKCEYYDVDKELFAGLINVVNEYKHFSNRSEMTKNVGKLLKKEYLHREKLENDMKELESRSKVKIMF